VTHLIFCDDVLDVELEDSAVLRSVLGLYGGPLVYIIDETGQIIFAASVVGVVDPILQESIQVLPDTDRLQTD
jgi:hypothetical protein